ncbi:MAG: hypothetical protein DRH30_07865 [Deltaproteobacteria bacterium]|nr:MAG: hypothetical protein DRH30_07865 [Deltaproteobacteria bacterium]
MMRESELNAYIHARSAVFLVFRMVMRELQEVDGTRAVKPWVADKIEMLAHNAFLNHSAGTTTPPPAGVETGPIDWAGTPREAFARAAEYCEVMGGTGWLIGARQDDPNRYGYEERQAYLHAARWMRANEAKYTAPPSQPPACAGEDHTHTADHECNENNNQELD